MLLFADKMTLDQAPRRTEDGYLVAFPKVARTGIQEYTGAEVGRPDLSIVRVYRPEKEVFSKDAMHSLAHRPVTIEHPPVMVDASNWKDYSVGAVGDEVVRDGDFIRVPLMLMDKKGIDAVESGKNEISLGYVADLVFDAGTSSNGEKYDAYQANIRGNHLAIVDKARGGSQLRVIDSNFTPVKTLKIDPLDGNELFTGKMVADFAKQLLLFKNQYEGDSVSTKKILVDGISLEVPETSAQVIEKTLGDAATREADLKNQVAKLQTEKAELSTKVSTQDAEIATLKKSLGDATNPAAIDAAVKARAIVVDSAKKIVPAVVVDGKTDAEIKRQVVDSKLGEVAKGWNDEQITASFASLTASQSATNHTNSDPFATIVKDGTVNLADAEKALADRDKELKDAWKVNKTAA